MEELISLIVISSWSTFQSLCMVQITSWWEKQGHTKIISFPQNNLTVWIPGNLSSAKVPCQFYWHVSSCVMSDLLFLLQVHVGWARPAGKGVLPLTTTQVRGSFFVSPSACGLFHVGGDEPLLSL